MGWRQPGLRKRIDHEATGIAHQHRLLRELFDELAKALDDGSRPRCQKLVSRLRSAVRAHFLLEEDVVFPALRGLRPEVGPQVEALSDGHEQLWSELERLESSMEEANLDETATQFASLRQNLGSHEAAEEALLSGGEKTS
jgi:hemerythrin superfamily protein